MIIIILVVVVVLFAVLKFLPVSLYSTVQKAALSSIYLSRKCVLACKNTTTLESIQININTVKRKIKFLKTNKIINYLEEHSLLSALQPLYAFVKFHLQQTKINLITCTRWA